MRREIDETSRWIFGYGSLIWRPAFSYLERCPGSITGFARRFWQGSPDHRGSPSLPGRVATLIARAQAVCWGMAYRLAETEWTEVVEALDEREQAGYRRIVVEVALDQGRRRVPAWMYLADADNAAYLGPASVVDIADRVMRARGHSGTNRDYLLQLAEALDQMGAHDDHVSELAARVRQLQGSEGEASDGV